MSTRQDTSPSSAEAEAQPEMNPAASNASAGASCPVDREDGPAPPMQTASVDARGHSVRMEAPVRDASKATNEGYRLSASSACGPVRLTTPDHDGMSDQGSSRKPSRIPHEAIDYVPPSASVMKQLEDVLQGQFGEIEDEDEYDDDATEANFSDGRTLHTEQSLNIRASTAAPTKLMTQAEVQDARPARTSVVNTELNEHGEDGHCSRLIESRPWTVFFMVLTFYALFAPDVDMLVGNNTSKFVLSIITSAVVILFLFELACQSVARKNYFLRAYFWLDVVALISLFPDTWFVQHMFTTSNAFVAGRSSRLTRLIRVASRSSKATRLNRLTRIARVASLMPRLGAIFGNRVKDDDTEKVLEKKLRRVFMFLDEDMDGLIPRSAVIGCLMKMKDEPSDGGGAKQMWKLAKVTNVFQNFSRRQLDRNNSDVTATMTTTSTMATATSGAGSRSQARSATAPSRSGELDSSRSEIRAVTSASQVSTAKVAPIMISPRVDEKVEPPNCTSETSKPTLNELHKEKSSKVDTYTSSSSLWRSAVNHFTKDKPRLTQPGLEGWEDDEEMVPFQVMKQIMLADELVSEKLRRAASRTIRQGNNMKNITSRHSETIAVKVALGVLVLLFVLGLVEPAVQDFSGERGLSHLTKFVNIKFINDTAQTEIPPAIRSQVKIWTNGVGTDPEKRTVLYVDLAKKVYCNEFVIGGFPCGTTVHNWSVRTSINAIDEAVKKSDYRTIDLLPVRVPDLSDQEDISDAELNDRTDSVAVLHVRKQIQMEAFMSIMTTILVIIIILAGIVLLTKDMTFLSRNLLKPLKELAEDMESIAQLQLAGVSQEEDEATDGTAEVRLLRRTFANMKKAIKSWGKYVPWPVVQMLLRAKVEANLQVNEVEVTIFFSDIASFTTIVESMPPESSLLLLSRYFNDMSKIIDDHGGVVLEFIGDAILCMYGAPLINPDHPSAAVKSSLRMLAALRKMNEWSAMRDLPEVKIRCGLHTGRVLVGNMGFHSRMKYGIVGEDAHIPSHLEEINKTYGTTMMISQGTWSRLDTKAAFITRPVDYVYLKEETDIAEPIYQVMDRERKPHQANALWEPATLHSQAMELYKNREFQKASKLFTEVNQMMSEINGDEDEPSTLMLKRCNTYMEQPPPPEWNGVWDRSNDGH